MSDPSWEQVINEVVIPGDPGAIRSAKGQWDVALAEVADAKRYLDDGLRDLAAWEGAAGDAYRTTIGEIAKKLRTFTDDYHTMPATLDGAATELDSKRSQIPIPDSMISDIGGYALLFAGSGILHVLAVGDIFNTLKADPSINGLRDAAGNVMSGLADAASHIPGVGGAAHDALDGLRDWVSTQDDEARRIYNELNGNYANTASNVPVGTYTAGRTDLNPTPISPVTMPHPGGPGGMPNLGAGGMPSTGGMPSSSGFDPTVGSSGLSGLDSNGFGDGTGTGGFDEPNLNTGLAGAGTGGLTGIGSGPGLGGLGGGLGPGSGAGGVGGGLGGAGRFPGLGTPVSPMMGMGGMGAGAGAGGAAGRGGRGAGRGGAGSRTGMMGGPHGGAARGSEEDHGTWLQEDEDVWGTDNDAAPPLLT